MAVRHQGGSGAECHWIYDLTILYDESESMVRCVSGSRKWLTVVSFHWPSWSMQGAIHAPKIATGLVLTIIIAELQERLTASTNVGSFPG